MRNYEAIKQWAAGTNAERAYNEITALRKKYPWLKCDESFKFIAQMMMDMPKVTNVIMLQEKQNAIHEEIIRVNQLADAAIVKAVAERVGVEL